MGHVLGQLKQDHDDVRVMLATADVLRESPQGREAFAAVCRLLMQQVRRHATKEAACVRACGQLLGRLSQTELACFALEHSSERRLLWVVNRLLQEGASCAVVEPVWRELALGLRQGIVRQERELFPILEDAALGHQAGVRMEDTEALVTDTMTVETLLRRYPSTWPVLQQLLGEAGEEPSTTLADIAWRCGLEFDELATRLERGLEEERPNGLAGRAGRTSWDAPTRNGGDPVPAGAG